MIYCYVCTNCQARTQKNLPAKYFRKRFQCQNCGKLMQRDIIAEHGAVKDTPANWPQESDAAGINPDQIREAMAYNKQMGVPTRYNPETGAAIFTSRGHRKKFCEASGLFDRSAGYGDQSPHNNMRKRRFRCQRTHA